MGSRGPSRTSKTVLKVRGSWLADVRGDEPKAEPATPKSLRRPSWLSPEGKRAWRQVVRQMAAMGILTMADVNIVARYCETWSRWRRALAFIMEHGEGYESKRDGKTIMLKYPQMAVAAQLDGALAKMEDRLGLSPGSRANLAIDIKGLSNEPASKARFFKGPSVG